MGSFFTTTAEALELSMRVLADTEPEGKADALCVFGQTKDNEGSVVQTAMEVMAAAKANCVVFLQTGTLITREIYHLDWASRFAAAGIPGESIIGGSLLPSPALALSEPKAEGMWEKERLAASTHTEALCFVELAKSRGWQTVYITASPFHQLRAFAEIATTALWLYPSLKIFNRVGKPLPWTTTAIHSQNVLAARRCELAVPEWERLENYHQKGDLASAREILNYLNWRDKS